MKVICVLCPLGCSIAVEGELISGNKCLQGRDFAQSEASRPMRTFTGSIRITGGDMRMLSIKSSRAIPKGKVRAAAAMLADMTVEAPVDMGDVVVRDVLGTGADIVATRAVIAVKERRRLS